MTRYPTAWRVLRSPRAVSVVVLTEIAHAPQIVRQHVTVARRKTIVGHNLLETADHPIKLGWSNLVIQFAL